MSDDFFGWWIWYDDGNIDYELVYPDLYKIESQIISSFFDGKSARSRSRLCNCDFNDCTLIRCNKIINLSGLRSSTGIHTYTCTHICRPIGDLHCRPRRAVGCLGRINLSNLLPTLSYRPSFVIAIYRNRDTWKSSFTYLAT